MLRHWLVRSLVQQSLWHLPMGVRLNALLARHNPEHELRAKHWPNLRRHLSRCDSLGPDSGHWASALEIGTGWDFDTALLCRLCGFDSAATADAFRHVRFKYVQRSLREMRQLAGEVSAFSERDPKQILADIERWQRTNSLEELQRTAHIRYFAPVSVEYSEVENESVDFCYSTAVLEHIRPDEVRQILTVLRHKLKPGALSSHVIDLKDHFAYFQPGLPYNHFLRFSSRQWERYAGNPMSYTNRLPASAWRQMFTDCGYVLALFEETKETTLLPLAPHRIHPENRDWTDRDLRIGELHVIARR